MNAHATIDWRSRALALQERLDRTEFELAELKAAVFGPVLSLPCGLAPMEGRIVELIRRRSPRFLPIAQIHAGIYADRDDAPVETTVHSHVSKARARLRGTGVEIRCVRFAGYAMTRDSASAWDRITGRTP